MTRLSHSQWDKLNRFCLKLHSECSREHFFKLCVEDFPRLLEIPFAAWQWMDEDFRFVDHTVTRAFESGVADYTGAMMEHMATHPAVQHVHGHMGGDCSGATLAMTDFLSLRQIQDLGIHADAYRHLGINDQVYTEFQFTNRIRAGITLNSSHAFTDEKRLMVDLLKPHLILAYRNLLQAFPDLGPGCMNTITSSGPALSPRLEQTRNALLQGLPRKLIADQMDISIHTLNDYVREIYAKLEVHSHAELITKLLKNRAWATSPTAFKREGP